MATLASEKFEVYPTTTGINHDMKDTDSAAFNAMFGVFIDIDRQTYQEGDRFGLPAEDENYRFDSKFDIHHKKKLLQAKTLTPAIIAQAEHFPMLEIEYFLEDDQESPLTFSEYCSQYKIHNPLDIRKYLQNDRLPSYIITKQSLLIIA